VEERSEYHGKKEKELKEKRGKTHAREIGKRGGGKEIVESHMAHNRKRKNAVSGGNTSEGEGLNQHETQGEGGPKKKKGKCKGTK